MRLQHSAGSNTAAPTAATNDAAMKELHQSNLSIAATTAAKQCSAAKRPIQCAA